MKGRVETTTGRASKGAKRATHAVDPARRHFLTLEQTAESLGLSVRSFLELRRGHQLYAPDGSRAIVADPKKDMPLWSDELVQLIAFARSKTVQGVRQLTDDEAIEVRIAMGDAKRREYLALVEG